MSDAVLLRTERLLLRPLVAADVPDVLAYRGSPEVCRYLLHEPRDEAEVRARIAETFATAPAHDGDDLQLAVESQGRVIGEVNLHLVSTVHRQAEIGWVFNPEHQGHGFATEAATALLETAFTDWGVHRAFAQLDPRNVASARLCDRLGMRREALLREESWFKGQWGDLAIYAILATEWARRGG